MQFDPALAKQIAENLPAEVQSILKRFPTKLMVAGGFVRDFLTEARPKDVDIFAITKGVLEEAWEEFWARTEKYPFKKKTKNTVTFCSNDELPKVQFIDKCFYPTAQALIESFDFTICQSAIYWNGLQWVGVCTEAFWTDICDWTAHYTAPQREEDPGASVLRMVKFARKGYEIPEDDIARVVGRFYAVLSGRPEDEAVEAVRRSFSRIGYKDQ
mgnify:FL=1